MMHFNFNFETRWQSLEETTHYLLQYASNVLAQTLAQYISDKAKLPAIKMGGHRILINHILILIHT